MKTQFQIASCAAVALLLTTAGQAHAQWSMQPSGSTASLRGIHAVDENTAWASGTKGTVLRTRDGGRNWQSCAVPRGAEKLDFRSVWAWDAEHAMVLSSGPGQHSRLYSTHDGCHSWRLVLTNPDAAGFWDALQFDGIRFGVILGDPVEGKFTLFATYDGGVHWTRQVDPCLQTVAPEQGAFAASNQALIVLRLKDSDSAPGSAPNHRIWFGTSGGWLYRLQLAPVRLVAHVTGCSNPRVLAQPGGSKNPAATGIFAIASRNGTNAVAVGGDYTQPRNGSATAAFTTDGDQWHSALRTPAGYRSTVEWDRSQAQWIAAGPSGSDISRDDGRTWQPLDHESWNALSLPFAVGENGRIGRLISWGQLRAAIETRAPDAHAQHKD